MTGEPAAEDEARTVWQGKWLRMKQRGRWEYVERTNDRGMAVIVVAVTPEGNLLFVEQERVPVCRRTIEMPAGLIGDLAAGEDPVDAARRELLEETGWRAQHIEILLTGPTSSGLSSEEVVFVRATGLVREHAGGGDDTERITVHEIPVAEAPRWLCARMAEGFAMDAKLWAGLWMVDRNPDGSPA